MAKAKKSKKLSSKAVRPVKRVTEARFRWSTIIVLVILFIGIIVSVMAAMQKTPPRGDAAKSCNQANCNQCLNGTNWMITNFTGTSDPDGDQQLCAWKARVGTCGGKDYCCPGPGQKWTTTMTACATPTPKPSATPTNTPTPTITPSSTPTKTPTPTSTPRPTSRPRPTSTRIPTATPSPTPVPLLSDVCGKSCESDADCKLGLSCVTVFSTLKACRNRLCQDNTGCTCGEGNNPFIFATPTPFNGASGSLRVLPVSIGGFTNSKSESGDQPSITGTSEPDAKITITIYPDGIGAEVYADKNGKWSYKPTKKLSAGPKNILVVATKEGAQGQISKEFTVKGGGSNPFGIILLLMIVAAVAFGGYVFYKSNN